jgi:hypothetical protein
MKLDKPFIEITKCPQDILDHLKNEASKMDWDNPNVITKEEAFFNQSYRYEAVTKYFNEENYFYSDIPPSTEINRVLKPYTDFLLSKVFTDFKLFRCQMVCLKPGQNVYPHIDPRVYHTYGKRIHLPLKITDKSFHVHFDENNNYEIILSKMTEGMITDFDNITPHSAFNYGDDTRIHVICDIVSSTVAAKLDVSLAGNPNAIYKNRVEEYYMHLSKIEERYQCDYQQLKPHYIAKMESL